MPCFCIPLLFPHFSHFITYADKKTEEIFWNKEKKKRNKVNTTIKLFKYVSMSQFIPQSPTGVLNGLEYEREGILSGLKTRV